MSDIDQKIALSLEAEMLLRNETLNAALDAMRVVGVEALLHAPAENMPEIIKWQAYVAAVDALRGQLGVYVTQGQTQKPRGSVA